MIKATNANTMRTSNRKLILDIIRKQPISRVDISAMTNLARASVTMIVDELLAAGLLEEASSHRRQVGRSPILLSIRGDARYIAGVNIKRVGIDIGYVTLGGELLCHESIGHGEASVEALLQRIAESLEKQRAENQIDREKVLGLGVCAPGPLDYHQGIVLSPPNFEKWHQVPVVASLHKKTGLDTALENVSNALALEERYFGMGRDLMNFMVIQINEGVGSGIVVDGHLFRGSRGLGSELGHTSISKDGILCACGNRGCLEGYASIPAILQGSPYSSWRALMDAYEHHEDARELVQREAEYLSVAIINAINLFDLEKIILMGDVHYKPNPLLRTLNRLVQSQIIMRANDPIREVCSSETDSFVRTAAISHINTFYQEVS